VVNCRRRLQLVKQVVEMSSLRGPPYYPTVLGWSRRAGQCVAANSRSARRINPSEDRGSGREWAQQTAVAFAEAVAREFDSVPASLDLEWLRACVDYLAQGDA